MRFVSLRIKLTVLFVIVMAMMLGLFIVWNNTAETAQAEKEMLEKAQILSQEMDATWEFFETNQHQFAKDKNGNYALYCVVAAKSVSKFFSNRTDYTVHYTNLSTRKSIDAPDEFETEALQALHGDPERLEYYQTATDTDGRQVFRYVRPLYYTKSCLECHGEPKGELDSYGFAKEGMRVGDMAGAISIIMPIDLYMQGVNSSIWQGVVLFCAVILTGFLVIFFGTSRLVTHPLRKFELAAEQIEVGDLDVNLEGIGDRDEIHDLALRFNSMTRQLKTLYDDLESQVDERTGQLASANEQLASANEVLEQQRAQLEQANVLLQENNQYKSDFLAIMSHELRTPLTSILAFIEIWEDSEEATHEAEANTVLEIKENGQILLGMVDNILEMARAEAGRLELTREPIDFVDLVGITRGTLSFLAKRRNITLTTTVRPDVPIINADWEKIRRIIENLTSNAIKYTRKGGKVDVTVSYRASHGCIIITVSDNGVGIEEKDLPHIFERFTQSDKSSLRRYRGSGLGLAVVKELVEAHGGTIEVRSVHKQGSVFCVYLPVGDNQGNNQ
jgi:signal transduction histidine kinase